MPKSQFYDPKERRKAGTLKFQDISINTYQKGVKDELSNYTKSDFMGMLEDMQSIREFEMMLTEIKTKGRYADKDFMYPGPGHLSTGQEAQAVGQAYALEVEDCILGSHRSHHEVIAKAFSAIKKLDNDKLMQIMSEENGGKLLSAVNKSSTALGAQDKAKEFFLYGMMAELFAKENGFCKGLGGSMHAFFIPFGIFPNNAIVGGSGTISAGVALFKKCNKKQGIVVCNVGDGAAGRGPVFEALNFAAMEQFSKLWQGDFNGGLPVLFNFNNNGYGMGGQTAGETMAYDVLARLGAGICPSQMYSERVDGYNVLAVIDAVKRKKQLLVEGKGPVMLDVITYRIAGHSTSDAQSYRTNEELDAWRAEDSIQNFISQLLDAKIATRAEIDELLAKVKDRNIRCFKLASDLEISPYADFQKDPYFVEKMMFSNQRIEKLEDRKPEVLMAKEENERVKKIATLERFYLDKDGKPVSKIKLYGVRDGLFEAIMDKFYTDPTLIAYGEDVRDWNGAFAVYRGLTEALPYNRLFNSPISESAIVGTAVGYAMAGGRVIVELMYCDFIGCAGDEIFNQMSKWQAMSANKVKMPLVLRVSVGSKYGAQHSQDWTALTAHIPGLKVVFPVTPYDAKGMMNTALMGSDPVVFFESQRVYDVGEMFVETGVPKDYYEVPFGKCDVKKVGSDITILTIGATLYKALNVAKTLKEKYDISAEIIDARSIVPFDYETLIASVKKTGKLLLASDACARNSVISDIAANITTLAFDYLDAPPVMVGAENWITPAYEFDAEFFPQESWILDAIHTKLTTLPNYVPTKSYNNGELIRKAKLGV